MTGRPSIGLWKEREHLDLPRIYKLEVEISLVYPNIMIYCVDGSLMTQGCIRTPGSAADWLWERPKELGSRFEI